MRRKLTAENTYDTASDTNEEMGDFVEEKPTPNGDTPHVSAAARFALAAMCCGVFVITVVVLAGITRNAPLQLLREVSFTFWAVVANFALCLGTVAYVSRRLHKARAARVNAR
jgi:hypothetical protein